VSQVVARESVASDHLVYQWPYPLALGSPIELSCGTDEVAVVCPAWAVGSSLGPGRHTYRSPDPSRPTAVYFVLTGPVQVEFDMFASFAMPGSGQVVKLRAQGSVLVRVADPALLVSQFVGLPFERVNDGLVRSVAGSVERMLGKLLPRKAALAGTVAAVAEPSTWPGLVQELTQYNPAVGAVHGVQFMRFNQMTVTTDQPYSSGVRPNLIDGRKLASVSGEIGGGGGGADAGVGGEWNNNAESTERGAAPSDPALVPPAMDAAAAVATLPAGTRVLVALADGLFHSATVRQALQGYYELDVGDTGELVWVPMGQVAPQV
jgi:hypothetical protein